ncbi:MAG: hypothetical protein PARBB_02240 [Parabacteroides distasonis]|uniref:hypothetical protein n=1 Tax=Parabacteroides sp. TaxID=1869337 RepID=UPI00257C8B68|nr:hypothetical protein [Parabacteroides sp.]
MKSAIGFILCVLLSACGQQGSVPVRYELILTEDKVYLYQDFNRQLEFDDFLAKSPLTITYDTLTHEVMVSDFKYPLLRTESDLGEGRTCSVEFSCCRTISISPPSCSSARMASTSAIAII